MNRVTALFLKIFFGICLVVMHSGAMASDLSGQLVISGSDTLEPLMIDLAKNFMNSNRGVKIVVRGGGTGKGIADSRSGGNSIGMVSRVLLPQEAADLRSFTIAHDGICLVTSNNNPVQNLTPAQLLGIYQGKINNWNEVGGNNLSINSVIRDRASSSNKVVAEFLGVRDTDLRGKVVNDAEAAMRLVSTDSKAIAFVSSGEAFHDKLTGMPINILSISGKKATLKTIATNSYPIIRPLSLITKGDPSPLAMTFISYCQSKAAASSIRSHKYVKPE
jgi:phosphate transport system substrate-binding protein